MTPVGKGIAISIAGPSLDDLDWWNGVSHSKASQYLQNAIPRRNAFVLVVPENANRTAAWVKRSDFRNANLDRSSFT